MWVEPCGGHGCARPVGGVQQQFQGRYEDHLEGDRYGGREHSRVGDDSNVSNVSGDVRNVGDDGSAGLVCGSGSVSR